ncbi:unnamed protein product [Heterotrigona itama]|uniref:Uncharacterized protein n=1 Tax=Heterotrigona itama TaxID=395501 RepID=A0A6V7HNK2_9HYME|nr:unnamed protein product [Heterotrigona itama]
MQGSRRSTYQPFAETLRRCGYIVRVDGFVVGAWHSRNNSLTSLLRYATLMNRRMFSKTIAWPRDAHVKHISGIRQYRVMGWTAQDEASPAITQTHASVHENQPAIDANNLNTVKLEIGDEQVASPEAVPLADDYRTSNHGSEVPGEEPGGESSQSPGTPTGIELLPSHHGTRAQNGFSVACVLYLRVLPDITRVESVIHDGRECDECSHQQHQNALEDPED